MPSDDSRDQVRRAVDNMTADEVNAVLDQIAALSPAEPLSPTEPTSPTDPMSTEPPATPPSGFPLHRNQPIDLPPAPEQPQALTLHVEVELVEPRVWRTIVVRSDLSLEDLHLVLQRAVGWQDYHLHRFWARADQESWQGPYFLTDMDVAEGELGTHERAARLDQVFREVGDALRYTYDFGDDWHHQVRLEAVGELPADAPDAVCTGGEMAGPLEDSGGPPGYTELVAAFSDDPPLSRLEDYVREWLPEGWDPEELDLDQVNAALSLIGASTQEIFAVVAGVQPPASLDALLEIAPPDALAALAELCRSAAAVDQVLGDAELAAIARPYRLLLDLAGDDGIPLTQAGWMKPVVVRELFTELGLPDWMGKGTREEHARPIAELRATAQDVGLLRKHKGRLLATRKAQQISSDRDCVEIVAAGLLRSQDGYLTAARGLFALLTVARGSSHLNWADEVADLLTRCGLRTGPTGVDRWDAIEMVRPTWFALDSDPGRTRVHPGTDVGAVGLAVVALWPERLVEHDQG